MYKVKNYVSSTGEEGIEIEVWQPGFRERKVGWLRIVLDRNSRKIEDEEIRIEIILELLKPRFTQPNQWAFFYFLQSLIKISSLSIIHTSAIHTSAIDSISQYAIINNERPWPKFISFNLVEAFLYSSGKTDIKCF